jgi:predicted transcriptional regulator
LTGLLTRLYRRWYIAWKGKRPFALAKRIGNANIFEAVISRQDAQGRLINELLALLGRAKLVIAHLVESGDLTLDDLKEAEKALRKSPGKDKTAMIPADFSPLWNHLWQSTLCAAAVLLLALAML